MNTSKITYTWRQEDEGKTIKEVLKGVLRFSDRLIAKLKNQKAILYKGENIFVDRKLKVGETLELVMEEEGENDIQPEKIPIDIIYEDEVLLVVNKPPGMVVHPTLLHQSGTLANGIIHHCREQGLDIKFRAVHRIDRDTSGLLVLAKNQYVHHQLATQMEKRTIERKYYALVKGRMEADAGKIEAPIGRAEGSIIERTVNELGQYACTYYSVKERYKDFTWVELQLATGRTHQIRVHMKHIGHPLLGDSLYGKEDDRIPRQALHAYLLGFEHPLKKEWMRFELPLAPDMLHVIQEKV